MEPQACPAHLQGIGAEPADQAQDAVVREKPEPLAVPDSPNATWSMDSCPTSSTMDAASGHSM